MHARVDKIARGVLGMHLPDARSVRIVQLPREAGK
jgi:cell division protein FtsL